MQIDPAVVIAFIGSILGLLGLTYRAFASGGLHPRTTVPREDYERVIAINEGYATKFGEQTVAIAGLARTVETLAVKVGATAPRRAGAVRRTGK